MADINVGGRLHSIATGNVLTGADEILDDSKGKKQSVLNAETDERVSVVEGDLNGAGSGIKARVHTLEEQVAFDGDFEVANLPSEIISGSGKIASANAVSGAIDNASENISNALNAKTGYYECSTNAGAATKVVTATNFILAEGGSIKIKMTNKNTSNGSVTLNIGGTGAKHLMYDGEAVSATNPWEDGETVEVYYDGTNYYANNVAGGGTFATGEKVKNVGIDDEPTAGSEKMVKSGGVAKVLESPVVSNMVTDFNKVSGHIFSNGSISILSTSSHYVVKLFLKEGDYNIVKNANSSSSYMGLVRYTSEDYLADGSEVIINNAGVNNIIHLSEGYYAFSFVKTDSSVLFVKRTYTEDEGVYRNLNYLVSNKALHNNTRNYIPGYRVLSNNSIAEASASNDAAMTAPISIKQGHVIQIYNADYYLITIVDSSITSRALGNGHTLIIFPDTDCQIRTSFLLSNIKESYIFDATDGKFLWLPKLGIDSVCDYEYKKNYIYGYMDNINGVAGFTGHSSYLIPYPFIKVTSGDTVAWPSDIANGSIKFFDADFNYITRYSATSYSSISAPANSVYALVGLSDSVSSFVKVNGKIVWQRHNSGISELIAETDSLSKDVSDLKETTDNHAGYIKNYTEGYWIGVNGILSANSLSFVMNEKIPCKKGDKFSITSGNGWLCTYDSNNTFLSYYNIKSELYGKLRDITISDDAAAYCRCGFLLEDIATCGIYKLIGNQYTLQWKAFSDNINVESTSVLSSNLISVNNNYQGVAEYYKEYIEGKCLEIFKKDVKYKTNGDSFIFLTDYHIPTPGAGGVTQFRHSGALVRYIQRHTQTKKFVFGGDTVCSPTLEQRWDLMREFLSDFRDTNMIPTIGNHEWRNTDYRGVQSIAMDYATFCSELQDVVFDEYRMPYYYFDNLEMKIRYFILYTPEMVDAYNIDYRSKQLVFLETKALELDSTWSIVVFQHIIAAGYVDVDENDEPITPSYAEVKTLLEAKLDSIMSQADSPRVLGAIAGHSHYDAVTYAESGYPYIITTDDGTYTIVNGVSDVIYPNHHKREQGTITEQAFDVMHIDLSGNKWDITRIGYGKNRVINMTTITISVGGTHEITPTIELASSEDSYSWWSGDTSICTVNNGVVTGVAEGSIQVRVANSAVYGTQTSWEYYHVVVTSE